MPRLISGNDNGIRWVTGDVPVKSNVTIFVDTRTGEGTDKVLAYLEDFIYFQAARMSLPLYSKQDVLQELRTIALDGMTRYDASKNANMLTFLQIHTKNRVIKLYKFMTAICRSAIHSQSRLFKVKCRHCEFKKIVPETALSKTICRCVNNSKMSVYPIAVPPFSLNEKITTEDGAQVEIQDIISNNDDMFAVYSQKQEPIDDSAINRVDFMRAYDKLENSTQEIVRMVMEGYTYREISKHLDISVQGVAERVRSLAHNIVGDVIRNTVGAVNA